MSASGKTGGKYFFEIDGKYQFYLECGWTRQKVDYVNCESHIYFYVSIGSTGDYSMTLPDGISSFLYVTYNGTTKSSTLSSNKSKTIPANGVTQINGINLIIPHDSTTGECNLTVRATIEPKQEVVIGDVTWDYLISTATAGWKIDTIPRQSTVSEANSFYAGKNLTVTIDRGANYVHKVDLFLEDELVATRDDVETSVVFEFTREEKKAIFKHVAKTSNMYTIKLTTYYKNSSGAKFQIGSITSHNNWCYNFVAHGVSYYNRFYIGNTFRVEANEITEELRYTVTINSLSDKSVIATVAEKEASPIIKSTSSIASQLYQAITDSTEKEVYFCIVGYFDEIQVSELQYIKCKMVVDETKNCPAFTSGGITYQDSNSNITNVTGNNQVIVQNKSNLKVSLSASGLAKGVNYATISKYIARFAGEEITLNSTGSALTFDFATVNATSNSVVTIEAVDSRGLATIVSKVVTCVPYNVPTVAIRGYREDDFSTNILLTMSGSYYPVTINGTDKNSIRSMSYSRKIDNGDWVSSSCVVTSDTSNYTFTSSNNFTLSMKSVATIKVSVTDAFGTTITSPELNVGSGIPLVFFDASRSSISFNSLPSSNSEFYCDLDTKLRKTLDVLGATTLKSTLSTSGKATLNSLEVTNGSTLKGTLGVTGATTLSTLSTSGKATLNSLGVTGATTIGGTLGVTGDTTLSKALTVTGNATLNGTLFVDDETTIDNALTVVGEITGNDTMTIDGTVYVGGVSTSGYCSFGTVLVQGKATFNQEVSMPSSVSVGSLKTTSNAKLYSLNVDTDARIEGGLTVTGSSSLGALSTSGKATLSSLEVKNGSTLDSTLSVTGATTLKSTLSTSGKATLSSLGVTNGATIGTTLGVTGATTLSTLSTSGKATLSSLGVTNGATIGTTLGVTGATTLSTVSSSGKATLNSLEVTNGSTLKGTLGVTGASTLSTLSTSGKATLNSLEVTNGSTLKGTLGVTGATTLSSTLGVTGATTLSSTLGVTGATSLSTLSTSGKATLNSLGVTGSATVGTTLGVTGATTLKSTLGVTGATTLSTLSTSGKATLNSLGVTGATTIGTTLGVTGATTLSTLSTSGKATLNSLEVTNGSALKGTLGVTGATTLSSTLGVTGATTLSSTLGVTGNTSLSTLSTSGKATLNSLGVTGSATVGTTLGVTGATSLSTLSTSGKATLNSLGVTGATTIGTTLGVTGNTSLSTLSTSGKATLNSLEVTGATTLAGTTHFGGNITGSLRQMVLTILADADVSDEDGLVLKDADFKLSLDPNEIIAGKADGSAYSYLGLVSSQLALYATEGCRLQFCTDVDVAGSNYAGLTLEQMTMNSDGKSMTTTGNVLKLDANELICGNNDDTYKPMYYKASSHNFQNGNTIIDGYNLQFKKSNNGYGQIYKNSSATSDYGLYIQDYNSGGTVSRITVKAGSGTTITDKLVVDNLTLDGHKIADNGNLLLEAKCTTTTDYATAGETHQLKIGYDSVKGAYVAAPEVYNRTTTGSATMHVTSAGTFYRITSSGKYKLDVVPAFDTIEDYKNILKIEPVKWFDKTACEINADVMTAEVNGEEIDAIDIPNMNRIYGCVAEQLEEVGLDCLVTYSEDNKEVTGVAYDRIPIMYIPLIKDLYSQIEELKTEIETLKQK